MTDDTPPSNSDSDLRAAIFGPAGENRSDEGSDNESADNSARFGAGRAESSTFVAAKPDYHGAARPLAKIVFVNILLNVLTLGFYRFWGKTRVRDYIWSHLRFQDENFEYSGTGKELFFGFLVALAALAPVIIGFSVLTVAVPNPAAQGLFALIQAILFVFLFQFAIYRARRYRMSRTQWRGIRAGQDGAATHYALKAMAYMVLTGVTLGLMYPWMHTALERYKVENTQFGDRPFTFDGAARNLFLPWLGCWILLLPTSGLSYLWYRAASFRYFTRCTRYEGLRFESDLTGGQIFIVYCMLSLIGFGLLMGAGVVIIAPISALGAGMEDFGALMQGPADNPGLFISIIVVMVLGVLAAMAAYAVLLVLFLTQRMIALHCHSLSITGDIDFDAIRQSALAAPSRGEGFADALDVGGV